MSASLNFSASPQAVYEMLHDAGYLSAKSQLAIDSSSSVAHSESGSVVTLTRRLASDLPDLARKFIGNEIVVTEIQAWSPQNSDGSAQAKMEVTFQGAPVRVDATIKLFANNGGTILELSGQVKASIPIFGAMAESAVAAELGKVTALEQSVGDTWLAENSS
jgi:hypothetical protein